jgi:hypothetical protein
VLFQFEAPGSVLNHIKAEVETKPVLRLKQVASKAERKEFRKQERNRFGTVLQDAAKATNDNLAASDAASVASVSFLGYFSNTLFCL